jgi:hypothetical protein
MESRIGFELKHGLTDISKYNPPTMLKLKTHSGFHDLFLNLLKHFQLIAFGARNKILQWFQYNYCLYRMLLALR